MSTPTVKSGRNLIGKRIIRIATHRDKSSGGTPYNDLVEIELEGGIILRPSVVEVPSAAYYGVELVIAKRAGRLS